MKYAKLQILRIRKRTKILISQPSAGKIVPEVENQNIRELVEGNYRKIYRFISEQRIDILTVHHSARNLTNRKIY